MVKGLLVLDTNIVDSRLHKLPDQFGIIFPERSNLIITIFHGEVRVQIDAGRLLQSDRKVVKEVQVPLAIVFKAENLLRAE